MNSFETKLIKDTFSKCFGMQSCLKSVRTQGDAIVSLSERTGLRILFIKDNLETICKKYEQKRHDPPTGKNQRKVC